MKNLYIRADASSSIGHGHIMRMIAVAQAWKRSFGNVYFLCQSCPDTLCQRLLNEGFNCEKIRCEIAAPSDISATRNFIEQKGAGALMIDGYKFDSGYLKKLCELKPLIHPIVSMMDDFKGDEFLDAVDLSIHPSLEVMTFDSEIDSSQKLLSGPKFALLRDEFKKSKERHSKRPECEKSGPRKKVLVSMGGSDPINATVALLDGMDQSLLEIDGPFIDLHVVVGASYRHRATLDAKIVELEKNPRVYSLEVISNSVRMPELMSWCDVIITAAGGMVWEWLFMEKPAAVVAIADNQMPMYSLLRKHALAQCLGHVENERLKVDDHSLKEWLETHLSSRAVSSPHRPDSISIDGEGANRVCNAIVDCMNS